MHIEFLVEEPSAEAALNNLAPLILGPEITFQVHPYNGKPDLLAKLPGRLAWLPALAARRIGESWSCWMPTKRIAANSRPEWKLSHMPLD